MTAPLKVLDLFSGIGGFSLGLERAGFETVAFCEINKFCQDVLKKHWPAVPVYDDVRTLDYDGPVDVICGGYPCQPFSTAGNRQGEQDDRHLWPVMFSLIQKHRPTWVIGENVAGHISMGLDNVLSDLESEAYACQPLVIPACAVDAKHRRDRLWIVAYTESNIRGTLRNEELVTPNRTGEYVADAEQCQNIKRHQNATQRGQSRETEQAGMGSSKQVMANTTGDRRGQMEQSESAGARGKRSSGKTEHSSVAGGGSGWPTEPDVGRVAHGVSRRVDRLRSLGNSVVPQIPEAIGRAIMKTFNKRPKDTP